MEKLNESELKRTHNGAGRFSVVLDPVALTQAEYHCCKGKYQLDILLGYEAVSTSTLEGTAKQHADRYQQSTRNLLTRMQEHNIPYQIKKGPHGRHVLVIGDINKTVAKRKGVM